MGVDRIGGNSKVTRDTPSAGFEKLDRADEAPPRNPQIDAVAKLYEKQFLHEMVKAMRSTVDFGAQKPSMAENIYRDQLDDQYVESWGDGGGVGLANLIYDQVMERYFSSPAGRQLKGNGGQGEMIPLTNRDVSRVVQIKASQVDGQVPLRVEVKPSLDGKPAKLNAPWEGEIVSNSRLEGGKTALTMAHGQGLKSTLIFQGVASGDARPGQRFEKGQQIGVLSPEIHSFLWNLKSPEVTGQPDSGLVR